MKPTDTPTTPPTTPEAQPLPDGQEFLEPEQLASDRSISVPPAQLSAGARAGLWFLRVFALIVSFMVIYTFVAQLH